MRKNKIIRDIDIDIWLEAKAQARLESMPLAMWLEEAIKARLGSETKRRKMLPDQVSCQLCNEALYKKPLPGQKRIIVHHDKKNNRNASVAMLLCDKCHKARHKEIGWGNPAYRPWLQRYGTFKCFKCKKVRNVKYLAKEFWKKTVKKTQGGYFTKMRRLCVDCASIQD